MKEIIESYLNIHGSGYVVKVYNKGQITTEILGNAEDYPNKKVMREDTLFDIASLTKIFTATLVYKAYEEGLISLNQKVKEINHKFINLDEITILDLLSHKVEIWTKGHLKDTKSEKELDDCLYNSYVKNNKRCYSDTHYIILSNLLEIIYNMSFDKLVEEKISKPLGLKSLTFNPNKELLIASTNYETINNELKDYVLPGTTHDDKARVAKIYNKYFGHAGIFCNANDLLKFLQTFIDKDNRFLKNETILMMLSHDNYEEEIKTMLLDELGSKEYIGLANDLFVNNFNKKQAEIIIENLPKAYNYFGTRFKHVINQKSDVPIEASDLAFVFSGYTGSIVFFDYEEEIIVVIMTNSVHLTKISRKERAKNNKEILNKIYHKIKKK